MAINHFNIKEELLNRIRNSDVISTDLRGVTTTSNTFSGDNTETEFTLSNDGVKNIRSVIVDDVTLSPLVDYTYSINGTDSENKIISFTTAPATGTDNIVISYDHSASGDRIYDDYDMHTIKSGDKFPRIAFDIGEEVTNLDSFNRVLYQSNLPFVFSTYGRGKNETEEISNNLRDFLITNREDFVRLRYIEPTGRGKLRPYEGIKDQKIFKKDVRFKAPFEYEAV